MLNEVGQQFGAEILVVVFETLVVGLVDDDGLRVGSAAVNLEDFSNCEVRLPQNLLANDSLVIWKRRLDYLIVVRGDDGVSADAFEGSNLGIEFRGSIRTALSG
jgi:hypothetical protein